MPNAGRRQSLVSPVTEKDTAWAGEVSNKLHSGAKQNPGILRPKALRYRPAVWRGEGGLQPPLWLEFRRAMNVTDLGDLAILSIINVNNKP